MSEDAMPVKDAASIAVFCLWLGWVLGMISASVIDWLARRRDVDAITAYRRGRMDVLSSTQPDGIEVQVPVPAATVGEVFGAKVYAGPAAEAAAAPPAPPAGAKP